jgi:uncharacterized membrane protein
MSPLFAFFGIWQTTLAAGVGAISIPVIIHLLNRRRFKIVDWAAMRFLLTAQKQNTKRIRLEQILLLLIRTLLVALLVLAMASVMDWAEKNLWARLWPEGAGTLRTNIGRTHHLLVLDGSLSMNARDANADEQTLFERARDMVHERLGQAQTGDFFSVLLMKETPTWIVRDPSPDFRKVQREIANLQASHGNASAGTAIHLIAGKITEFAPRFPNQVVYFFTDLQHSTWSGIPRGEKSEGPDEEKAEKDPLRNIKDKAQIVFVDVVPPGLISKGDAEQKANLIENVAVTGLEIDEPFAITGADTPIRIQLRNFGTGERIVHVSVAIAPAPPADQEGDWKPRDVRRKVVKLLADTEEKLDPDDFRVTFPAAGVYALEVRIDSGKGDQKGPDALPQDDVRRLIVTVKDKVPVLMVNGKPPAGDRFDSATEYARMALNPYPADAIPKSAPLHPRVVTSLADLQEKEWDEYDCIFLCDVPTFTPQEVKRLENFVRRGGGVVFSMGDRSADQMPLYNEVFFKNEQGLLPAILERKIVAPQDHHFYLEADSEDEFKTLPLAVFREEDRVALGKGRFRTYVQARLPKETRVHRILNFRAGVDAPDKTVDMDLPVSDPAMLEWHPPIVRAENAPVVRVRGKNVVMQPRMRGKVVLITTALNMDWSNWPGSPSFGALMQETARLGVWGKLRALSFPVGATLEEYLPGIGGEIDTAFLTPNANKPVFSRTKYIDESNYFRWPDTPSRNTDLSGYYQLRLIDKAYPNMVLFAVNTPLSSADQRGTESDLLRASKTDIESMLPGWEIQLVTALDDVEYNLSDRQLVIEERAPVGPVIARYTLWLVLLLALAEVILAWKFGHYSVTEGALAEQQTNWFWPIGALVVALLFAIPIGFILWTEHYSGEFLHFLSDDARKWAEGFMQLQEPEEGEGSHWELGRQAVFLGVGRDGWILTGVLLFAVILTYLIYRVESPRTQLAYRLLLGTLRVFFLLLLISIWMPQLDWRFDRQGWPDLVILLDTSQSMGEPDIYRDEKTRDKSAALGEKIKGFVKTRLPEKLRELERDLEALKIQAQTKPALLPEVEERGKRVRYYQSRVEQLEHKSWRPTRLELAQAVLGHGDRDWISHLVKNRKMKVHVFQLDAAGRAAKIPLGNDLSADINDAKDAGLIDSVKNAIDRLDPEAKESRLGIAVRQVIEQYSGASLAGVIMFTDGVTTRDETLAQVGEYASQKAVPLFFVGIGDEQEVRDLKLHDLQISDSVYVNDNVVIEAKLTGQGYKDLEVPVLLKVKDKDGNEKEVARAKVRVDPAGRPVRFRMQYTPTEVGNRNFVLEIEQPREQELKAPMAASLRLERTIEVIDNKLIKVLYVEGQPRYEFRYLKFLLERQRPEPNAKAAKDKKAIDVSVVLMDADRDFASIDNVTLKSFPATPTELAKYDVVIVGDVNPQDLGDNNMRNLAAFAKGPEPGAKMQGRAGGGGVLFIAGGLFNPHSYKGTPLADILPVIPLNKPNEPANRDDKIRLETTPIGWQNPIFRFTSNDKDNLNILQRLAPMYWTSSGYKLQPLAEVLAVHPAQKADIQLPGPDQRLPLVVHHFVGSGRSMFFGFDETWRWRFRNDEKHYNQFWIQTIRYLARGRNNRTDLRLDRQTPYRMGDPIKVTVRFPENSPLARDPMNVKEELPDVKVAVEYRPHSKDDTPVVPEIQTVKLSKLEGSLDTYEFTMNRTQEGKYRFRLVQPDVSKIQNETPSADAVVETPPGELDKLRMNYQDMTQAADATAGRFYTLLNAEQLLDELPSPARLSLNSPRPPILLWNHWLLFLLGMFLLTSEWLLRKNKHLL